MEHKEVVERFIEAKAVDFDAIGKLMSEFGQDLARSDDGVYGVVVGRPFTLACFLLYDDLTRLVGNVRGLRDLGSIMNE